MSAPAHAREQDLYIRWDGLGLWRTGRLDDNVAIELLGGVTIWPSLSPELAADWSGGALGGLRLSATAGELQLLRAEAELLLTSATGSRPLPRGAGGSI